MIAIPSVSSPIADRNGLSTSVWRQFFQILAGSTAVPTGAYFPFGIATAPAGYLSCNGAAVSRTTYANLFAVIGTTFGVGDGTTTFNLPTVAGNVIKT